MYSEKVRRIPRVSSSRKDKFRERERYRRSFWGTVFLELVLQKIEEDEFFDLEEQEEEEKAACRKKNASSPRILKAELGGKSAGKKSAVKWRLPAERKSVCTEWENILVWASGDWLELSVFPVGMESVSEEYSALVNFMRCMEAVSNNRIYYDSNEILRKYYDGGVEKFYVERAFYRFCREYIRKGEERSAFYVYDVLSEVYEYFARANTRNAVRKNNEEGRTLVEESGISWTGCSYYNADYYDRWLDMRQMFRRICGELAEEYDMDVPDFEEIEAETRFRMEGGLSFHGAWSFEQRKNNYPPEEFGMRELSASPPQGFLYFYRDYFNEGQYPVFEGLQEGLRQRIAANPLDQREFYSIAIEKREYHNGLSYLLERNLEPEEWRFLANFKLHRTAGCIELLCGRGEKGGSTLC